MSKRVEIYDTTLRDGTQAEGLSPTVGDKLRVARLLDRLGVDFIEGGWPGANPKDDEFFERAKTELQGRRRVLVTQSLHLLIRTSDSSAEYAKLRHRESMNGLQEILGNEAAARALVDEYESLLPECVGSIQLELHKLVALKLRQRSHR